MRPFAFLFALPVVYGCALPSPLRAPHPPSEQPLAVRLYKPTAGVLNYHLSEPAYVAIFSVTQGRGISLIFPFYQSQIVQSHKGFNQETVHRGSDEWGSAAGARSEPRPLFGYADAFYVVASKYPLPVEVMLESPYRLRSLMGATAFLGRNLTDTWEALESILVADLPADAWASAIYLNWRDPFATIARQPPPLLRY